ncbi:MAG: hypothetical protein JWP27_883 [Flaviaesturariibacter sp.]|nr:hypothetical protein [Flaviaesturariibacter sp.]
MKNLFILFAAVLTLASCSKDVKELAAPTETGANTFGASIDGKLWAPQGFGIAPTAPLVEASFTGASGYLINARNFGSSPTETEFEIYLANVTGPGTYQLNQDAGYERRGISYGFYTERRGMPKHQWITSSSATGTVVITKLDLANHIIAGTFSFTARDTYGDAGPITVTDGRFDVKIQ